MQYTPQRPLLQHILTATHCNRLQQTATDCNTLRQTATHCNTLQHTATHGIKAHCSKTPTSMHIFPFHIQPPLSEDLSRIPFATHCNTCARHVQHTALERRALAVTYLPLAGCKQSPAPAASPWWWQPHEYYVIYHIRILHNISFIIICIHI